MGHELAASLAMWAVPVVIALPLAFYALGRIGRPSGGGCNTAFVASDTTIG